jgi:hypothetical protein
VAIDDADAGLARAVGGLDRQCDVIVVDTDDRIEGRLLERQVSHALAADSAVAEA